MLRIVTDSTAYLDPKIAEAHEISVVPLSVQLEKIHFDEGSRFSNKEFYNILGDNKSLFPKTSQPSMGKFLETYKKFAPSDEIISIHLSGEISGTVKSAETAAKMLPEYNITVIDSWCSVAGLECMVTEAARLANQGYDKTKVIRAVEHIRENSQILFMVDSFEYLRRGGRIGGAKALLGTLLQVKPILYIKNKIDVFSKVRTRKKALEMMTSELDAFLQNNLDKQTKTYIIHVAAEKEATEFSRFLSLRYPTLEIEQREIGPVIGAHVGPGALGIVYASLLEF